MFERNEAMSNVNANLLVKKEVNVSLRFSKKLRQVGSSEFFCVSAASERKKHTG